MDMEITFPGGARVDASAGQHTIKTDQPPQGGGEGSAPTPFSLFLASIGTCAGIYVLGFCRQRGISTDGLRITQRNHADPDSGMIDQVELEIKLPDEFPEQYRDTLIRTAELCAVKKHLQDPPEFNITAR
ncbi:MAG: OsmC family protein [Anaerolineales bacterium]|nr:OsmC family protein [Anaerolineales bacterium]